MVRLWLICAAFTALIVAATTIGWGPWPVALIAIVLIVAMASVTMVATRQAERARSESDRVLARLAAIVNSSTDAIFTVSPAGLIETWNEAAVRLYGYSAVEAIGQPSEVLWADGSEVPGLAEGQAGEQLTTVGRGRRRDGTHFDASTALSPVRSESGIVASSFAVRDITARRNAERELQRVADAAEHGTDAIVSVDPDGCVRRWNRGAERLYGYSAAEAIGRQLMDLTKVGDEPTSPVARLRAGETTLTYEARRRCKDGSLIDVRNTVVPWRVDGAFAGVTGVTIDLTERKRFERELTASRATLRAALSSMSDAVFISDADGRFVEFNEAFATFHRFADRDAVLGSLQDYPAPSRCSMPAGGLRRSISGPWRERCGARPGRTSSTGCAGATPASNGSAASASRRSAPSTARSSGRS